MGFFFRSHKLQKTHSKLDKFENTKRKDEEGHGIPIF